MWPCSWFRKRYKKKRVEMYKRLRGDNRVIDYIKPLAEHGFDPALEQQQMKEEAELLKEARFGPILGSPYKKADTPGSIPDDVDVIPNGKKETE